MIPNRFHFVWSGRRFPYFARLAIESVLVHEPDASVHLHTFDPVPSDDELASIVRHERVSVHAFDPQTGFQNLEVDSDALASLFSRIPRDRASARANLVRYAVLARHGGIYLDSDIVVVRSLADLRDDVAFVGEEQVLSIDGAWQAGERSLAMVLPSLAWGIGRASARLAATTGSHHLARIAGHLEPYWQTKQVNNAVIGAEAGASFIRHLLGHALAADPTIRYALGPTLIDFVATRYRCEVTVLPPEVFYVVPPSYSFRFFTGGLVDLPPATRLLHVVSSNHRELLARLDEGVVRQRAARGIYYAHAADVASRISEVRS